jgi:hypothetical protein
MLIASILLKLCVVDIVTGVLQAGDMLHTLVNLYITMFLL